MSRFRILALVACVAASVAPAGLSAAPGCDRNGAEWTGRAACVLQWDPGTTLFVSASAATTASGPRAHVSVRVVLFNDNPHGTLTFDSAPLASCSTEAGPGERVAACGSFRRSTTGTTGTKVSVLCIVEGAIGGSYRCE